MRHSLVELESIVREAICGVCTDRHADGVCGLAASSPCALFHLFPQVTQAIQSARGDDVQKYVDAVRRDVCAVCAHQTSDGYCEDRQQVRCALDAYLLLVVDAIEGVTDRSFNARRSSNRGERQHRGYSGGKA